jgi:hypothetical protein
MRKLPPRQVAVQSLEQCRWHQARTDAERQLKAINIAQLEAYLAAEDAA